MDTFVPFSGDIDPVEAPAVSGGIDTVPNPLQPGAGQPAPGGIGDAVQMVPFAGEVDWQPDVVPQTITPYAAKLQRAEWSPTGPNKNPNSSATGPYQFLERTWLDLLQQTHPELTKGRSRADLLALRNDPNLSREIADYYGQRNSSFLRANGVQQVGDAERHLAHFAGPKGALDILTADPNTPISDILSEETLKANRGVKFGNKRFAQFTAGDLHQWAAGKQGGSTAAAPKFAPFTGQLEGEAEPDQPGFFSSLGAGVAAGARDVLENARQNWRGATGQSEQTLSELITGEKAAPPQETDPRAAPIDFTPTLHPDLSKVGYHVARGLVASFPEMAAMIGVGGATTVAMGGPENPATWIAAPVAGALGAGGVSAARNLYPLYVAQKQKGLSDDDAWTAAKAEAVKEGVVTAATFALFEARPIAGALKGFFSDAYKVAATDAAKRAAVQQGIAATAVSPVRNIAEQAFVAQPGMAGAVQAGTNLAEGKPVTEGVVTAMGEAGLGTVTPMAAHHGLKLVKDRLFPGRPPRTGMDGEIVPPDEGAPPGTPQLPGPEKPPGGGGPEAGPEDTITMPDGSVWVADHETGEYKRRTTAPTGPEITRWHMSDGSTVEGVHSSTMDLGDGQGPSVSIVQADGSRVRFPQSAVVRTETVQPGAAPSPAAAAAQGETPTEGVERAAQTGAEQAAGVAPTDSPPTPDVAEPPAATTRRTPKDHTIAKAQQYGIPTEGRKLSDIRSDIAEHEAIIAGEPAGPELPTSALSDDEFPDLERNRPPQLPYGVGDTVALRGDDSRTFHVNDIRRDPRTGRPVVNIVDEDGNGRMVPADSLAPAEAPPPAAQAEPPAGGLRPWGDGFWYPGAEGGPYETRGWKLHLNVRDPALAREISDHLQAQGVPHKIGHDGDQDGKGMTVYVGHKDLADRVAADLDQRFGDRLPQAGEAVKADDRQIAGNVWGRFDASDKRDLFHQYGRNGLPWLFHDAGQMKYAADRDAAMSAADERADKALRHQYGDFYTGTEKPAKAPTLGDRITAMGAGSKADGDLDTRAAVNRLPRDRLIPEPAPEEIDPSWTPEDRQFTFDGVRRMAAIGEFDRANGWLDNLRRPKSRYWKRDGLERLLALMERQAAEKAANPDKRLPPVPFEPSTSLDGWLADTEDKAVIEGRQAVEPELTQRTLDAVNKRARMLAERGYGRGGQQVTTASPYDVRQLSDQITLFTSPYSRYRRFLGANRLGYKRSTAADERVAEARQELLDVLARDDQMLTPEALTENMATYHGQYLGKLAQQPNTLRGQQAAAELQRRGFTENPLDMIERRRNLIRELIKRKADDADYADIERQAGAIDAELSQRDETWAAGAFHEPIDYTPRQHIDRLRADLVKADEAIDEVKTPKARKNRQEAADEIRAKIARLEEKFGLGQERPQPGEPVSVTLPGETEPTTATVRDYRGEGDGERVILDMPDGTTRVPLVKAIDGKMHPIRESTQRPPGRRPAVRGEPFVAPKPEEQPAPQPSSHVEQVRQRHNGNPPPGDLARAEGQDFGATMSLFGYPTMTNAAIDRANPYTGKNKKLAVEWQTGALQSAHERNDAGWFRAHAPRHVSDAAQVRELDEQAYGRTPPKATRGEPFVAPRPEERPAPAPEPAPAADPQPKPPHPRLADTPNPFPRAEHKMWHEDFELIADPTALQNRLDHERSTNDLIVTGWHAPMTPEQAFGNLASADSHISEMVGRKKAGGRAGHNVSVKDAVRRWYDATRLRRNVRQWANAFPEGYAAYLRRQDALRAAKPGDRVIVPYEVPPDLIHEVVKVNPKSVAVRWRYEGGDQGPPAKFHIEELRLAERPAESAAEPRRISMGEFGRAVDHLPAEVRATVREQIRQVEMMEHNAWREAREATNNHFGKQGGTGNGFGESKETQAMRRYYNEVARPAADAKYAGMTEKLYRKILNTFRHHGVDPQEAGDIGKWVEKIEQQAAEPKDANEEFADPTGYAFETPEQVRDYDNLIERLGGEKKPAVQYHVLPVKGPVLAAAKGHSWLLSWAYKRSAENQLKTVLKRGDNVILDNGAYTHWRREQKGLTNEAVDWDDFYDWARPYAEQYPDQVTIIIPDVIMGNEGENDGLTDDALDRIMDKQFRAHQLMPVWHTHESIERLQRLATEFDRIAIGATGEQAKAGSLAWHQRLTEAFDAISEPRWIAGEEKALQIADGIVETPPEPRVSLHMLRGGRFLAPHRTLAYPFDSADSSNLGQNAHRAGEAAAQMPDKLREKIDVPRFWNRHLGAEATAAILNNDAAALAKVRADAQAPHQRNEAARQERLGEETAPAGPPPQSAAAEGVSEPQPTAEKQPLPIPEAEFATLLRSTGDDLWFKAPERTVRIEERATAAGELTVEQAQNQIEVWRQNALDQGKSRVNRDRVVLSLFDHSGVWSQPWEDAGYTVHRFDIQDGRDIRDFDVEYLTAHMGLDRADVILAAPPCTDFTSSGAQYWAAKDEAGKTAESVELVRQVLRTVDLFRPAIWALENPVGRIAKVTGLPKPTITFQPHNFGDPYTKRTLLWGNFVPDLPVANVHPAEGSKIAKLSSTDKYGRSLTPEGFAYAFFQANNLHDMGLAQALAREFKEMPAGVFQEAVDAGLSEYDIRHAISDTYYDARNGDPEGMDYAVEELRRAIAEKTGQGQTPAKPTTDEDAGHGGGSGDRGPAIRDVGPGGERETGGGMADGQSPREADHGGVEGTPAAHVPAPEGTGGAGATGARPVREVRPVDEGEHAGGPADTGRTGGSGKGLAADGAGGRDEPQPAATRPNHYIADPEALIGGTPKVRFARNRAAIEAMRAITEEGRDPTQAELDAMAGYIGWGSFGQELFQGNWEKSRPKPGWEAEDKWLREHLGEAEWNGAQASIINAHYTDPPTVTAMWDMVKRMGFTGGRVLEPSMGIGNFFGLMPRDLMAKSDLTGIELDTLTGGMAKLLYPQANVQIKGYQDSRTPDNFYDLVIGNWPFAKDGPADRRYDKLSPSLHDYFFLKALDQTRPGGLVVGITSAGTMDKLGRATRLELAKKGELIAAFRLPSGAFEKYAGTKVVTDIIVLRKRAEPLTTAVDDPWVQTAEVQTPSGTPVRVNAYYVANPDHILGTLNYGHGTTTFRPGMIVDRPADIEQRLADLPNRVPEGTWAPFVRGKEPRFIASNSTDRDLSVTTGPDGNLYQVQGDRLARLEDLYAYKVKDARKTAAREAQIKALVELRRAYGKLIDAEREAAPNTEKLRTDLRRQYEAFTAAHGPVSKSDGLTVLNRVDDPSYATLAALELPDGQPSRVMFEPTVRGVRKLANPSVRDAFVLARNEQASLDLKRVAELAKRSEDEVARDLLDSGAIFRVPGGGYEVADVFLSGNVRRKLREAQEASERGEDMAGSIAALQRVLPKDIPYFQIEAKAGAPWVSNADYREFIGGLLGLSAQDAGDIQVRFTNGSWKVRFADRNLRYRAEATSGWGSEYEDFDKIVQAALNSLPLKVMTKDVEGNLVVDEDATKEVNEKAARIREEFSAWAWRDPERRVRLEKNYNEVMNAIATPSYDGSFLDFSGMALKRGTDPFSLRSHQVNAIWRGLANRSGLYAHEVGTGKTYTMGGIAVESRRYGLAKKPLILAHNANSASVAREINEMYPGAKVLYVDNLAPATLPVTMRRIANEDWDAVVIPHSVIDRMALSEKTLRDLAAEEIAALETEAISAAEDDGVNLTLADMDDPEALKKLRSPTAKQLVHQRNKIIQTIQKLANRASKEGAIPFEDLGIDMLLVDEAHEFKKPPIVTKMRVRGLNTQTSDRSIALRFLTDYVKRQQNGKGVHLFTGTPITNTLTEIYNMQRFVMDADMARDGIRDWDAWFNTFADAETDTELTSTGEYEPVTRLAQFVNTAELRRMIGQYMDIVFADDMPEFKPRETASGKTLTSPDLTPEERAELADGRAENPIGRPYKKVVNDVGQMSDAQRDVLAHLVELARRFKQASKKVRREMQLRGDEAIPIRVETAAANASLDVRLYDMNAEDHPGSKVNRLVGTVMKHYREHPEATQAVFMEIGFSDYSTRTRSLGNGEKNVERVARFNLAKDIVAKLVKAGIPREQIAVVDGSVSKEKRMQIADAMNAAKIRVVIGNRDTLGVGVNMQRNLRAMHHLDAPWMPGELEQSNGRGHRQGNKWNTVLEYRYITDQLDGRRWQVLAKKQRFITDFMKADENTRIIEGDAVSLDEKENADDLARTLSEAAGDPRLLQRTKLQANIVKLENRERLHTYGVADAKGKVRELASRNEDIRYRIGELQKDVDRFETAREAGFSATIAGRTYTERAKADEAIAAAVQLVPHGTDEFPLGTVQGFPIIVFWPAYRAEPAYQAVGAYSHTVKPSVASIEGTLRGLRNQVAKLGDMVTENEGAMGRLADMAKQPFAQAETLAAKRKMLADLEADLQRNPVPAPSWLRFGAPTDTKIWVKGEPRVVEGHKWTAKDWYVVTAEGDVPYLQAKDEQGNALYEPRPFVAPQGAAEPKGPTFTERKVREGSGAEPGRRPGTRAEPFTAPPPPVVHPDWATAHAKDTVGQIVWSRGDLALLRGYSSVSGNPLYLGVKKGVGRTNVDIRNYTGKDFTTEEVSDLADAARAAVAEDQRRAAERPDGPFTGATGQIVASRGVDPALAQTVEGWLKLLGIKGRVFLTTAPDMMEPGAAERYGLYGDYASALSAGVHASGPGGMNGFTRVFGPNGHLIVLDGKGRVSRQLEVVAHEIGHILEKEAWTDAPAEVKAAVRRAYEDWRKTAEAGTVRGMVESLRPHSQAKGTKIPPHMAEKPLTGANMANLSYWTSFGEWFADNVARWATSAEKPRGVVAQFFARIGEALRRLYASVAGKRWLPNEELAKWLDSRSAPDFTDQSKMVKEAQAAAKPVVAEPAVAEPAAKPVAAKAKKPTPTDMAEAYYQPGRVVPSYTGRDVVQSFERTDDPSRPWQVRVIAADENGTPIPGERERVHATEPFGGNRKKLEAWYEKEGKAVPAAPAAPAAPIAPRALFERHFGGMRGKAEMWDVVEPFITGEQDYARTRQELKSLLDEVMGWDAGASGLLDMAKRKVDAALKALRDDPERPKPEGIQRMAGGIEEDPLSPGGPTRMSPEAEAALGGKKGPIQKLRDLIRGPWLPHTSDLGGFLRAVGTPELIASLHQSFAPVWRAAKDRMSKRATMIHDLNTAFAPYFNLRGEDKRLADKFIELANALQVDPIKRRLRELTNTIGGKDDPGGLQLSEKGETVRLTDKAWEAVRAYRDGMDRALDIVKQQLYRDWGVDPAAVKNAPEALGRAADYAEGKLDDGFTVQEIGPNQFAVFSDKGERVSKIRTAADAAKNEYLGERQNFWERFAYKLQEIERARASGYMPMSRYGDHAVFVWDKDNNLVALHTYETDTMLGKAFGRAWKKADIYADRDRLRRIYKAEDGYTVSDVTEWLKPGHKNLKDIGIRLGMLDMLSSYVGADGAIYEPFREAVMKKIQEEGFKSHFLHRKRLPGYSADIERNTRAYIMGLSGHMAKREFQPKIDAALAGMNPRGRENLFDYAKRYVDYLDSGKAEAEKIRMAAYMWALGGNISSFVRDLFQLPNIAWPYLGMIAGHGKAAAALARASLDVVRMMRLGHFDLNAAPADVRKPLMQADKTDVLAAQQSQEQMAVASGQSQTLRQMHKTVRQAVQMVTGLYSAAQRVNRLATFIAAHRLARDPAFRAKAMKTMRRDAGFMQTMRDVTDPAEWAARWASYATDATHFDMSKVNRPQVQRGGLGATVTQFRGFHFNNLALLARMAKGMYGREGQAAFALSMAGYVMVAGAMGLPFAQNIVDLAEAVSKQYFGMPLNLMSQWYQFANNIHLPSAIAEFLWHGGSRFIIGDMGRRLGLGDPLPTSKETGIDFPSLAGPAANIFVGGAANAARALAQGRPESAAAAVLPPPFKGIAQGARLAREGYRTQATGKVIIPPDQITTGDVVAQSLGFRPTRVARASDLNVAQMDLAAEVRARNQHVSRQIQTALIDLQNAKTPAQAANAHGTLNGIFQAAQMWNQAHPHPEEQIKLPSPQAMRQMAGAAAYGMDAKRQPRQIRGGIADMSHYFPR